tara:strand:+ start:76 stop:411 length:336 start_codon:yes stop_codon:yes gene_type:complete
MKLTQELIDQIQEAMLHTKKDGSINWKDGDEVVVQLAGTFAADRFIVIKNKTKDPVVSAEPHPYFDYEKKVFTKDGREEYMEQLKALDKQHMKEYGECVDHLVDSMGEQKK